jgi:hypothetical protein
MDHPDQPHEIPHLTRRALAPVEDASRLDSAVQHVRHELLDAGAHGSRPPGNGDVPEEERDRTRRLCLTFAARAGTPVPAVAG